MKKYITNESKHCFYGNVSNILNYYNIHINEAELVLLSNIMNGEYVENGIVQYIGFPNEKCSIGLHRIGCEIKYIKNKIHFFELLSKDVPILFKIQSQVLNYNNIYLTGSSRKHYIVAIRCCENSVYISDSFTQSFAQSTYQGNIDSDVICRQFDNKQASGIAIIPGNNTEKNYEKDKAYLTTLLDEYIQDNISNCQGSICKLINKYCRYALENASSIMIANHLEEMAYQLKFSGFLSRLDYLIQLFSYVYKVSEEITEELNYLKKQWNIVVNKLRKCCITQNFDYYNNIFMINIPHLLEIEFSLYKRIANFRGIKDVRINR